MPKFFDDNILYRCKNAKGSEVLIRNRRFATSRMEMGTCYLDCVFEATNVTSGGGRILNSNNLLKVLNEAAPNDPSTLQTISSAVVQCINELNTGTMKIRNPTQENCSTIPSAIMICIHRKL